MTTTKQRKIRVLLDELIHKVDKLVKEATTPFCRFCRMARNERCSCADHELCRDCPMPRSVMIAERHLEVME